jgi:hypothetical protein
MTEDAAPDEDIPRPVFTYEAVVSLEIEDETARFDSDPSDPATRLAIVQPLEWIEIWPDLPVDTPAELQAAAFAKLYLLLSFGSELGGRTGDEIREVLDGAYPELARLRHAGQGAQPPDLARYGVRGMILADGSPQWGIQIPARAHRGTFPGIPADGERGEEALKIYAQNLMRARMHDLWRGVGDPIPAPE